ncbi:MAG: transcriptional regulator [Methanospirillaceae archaeon]|nr:transcriptional regulator [Methanospirillaceae archaeon]
MSQERLLNSVISVMLLAGFQVSEQFFMRPRSFDIVASNKEETIIMKVVSHIDSVSEEIAYDLDQIAHYINGSPLIIGERARDALLERGAVYLRYGIYAINVATLHDYFVEDSPPLIYASPGGLYVNISGERFHELREKHNLSLGDMAHMLGVSRRTISKYESGMGTTIEIAIKIEETFDHGIIESIELLDYDSQFEGRADVRSSETDPTFSAALSDLGIELHAMHRAPFQAMILYDDHTILTGYGKAQKIIRRAEIIGNISEVTGMHAMCVATDDNRQRRVGKTLVVGEETLLHLEEAEDLIDMVTPKNYI